MEVILAQRRDAAGASRHDIVSVASFQCANRLACHPSPVSDVAGVEGGQPTAMEAVGVEHAYPEPGEGSHDCLTLFGIEILGHASGKERHPATRRAVGNDWS